MKRSISVVLVTLLLASTAPASQAGETLQDENFRLRIPDGCVPASAEDVREAQVALDELIPLLPIKVRRPHALRVLRFLQHPDSRLTVAVLDVVGDLTGVSADALGALVHRNLEMRGGGDLLTATARPVNPGLTAHVADGTFGGEEQPHLLQMAMVAADNRLILLTLTAPESSVAPLQSRWQVLLGSLRVGASSAALAPVSYQRIYIVVGLGLLFLLVLRLGARRRRRMRTVLFVESMARRRDQPRPTPPQTIPATVAVPARSAEQALGEVFSAEEALEAALGGGEHFVPQVAARPKALPPKGLSLASPAARGVPSAPASTPRIQRNTDFVT